MLTTPVECAESTPLLIVCGVLPVPVRVNSVVLVAPSRSGGTHDTSTLENEGVPTKNIF